MADSPVNAVVEFFLAPPYIGLIFVFIIATIYIIYFLFVKKNKQDDYESPKFEEFVPDDINNKFKFAGKKIKGELIQNMNRIGRVDMVIFLRGKFPLLQIDRNKIELTDDYMDYDMVAFRVVSDFPLLRWFGIGRHYAFLNRNQMSETIDPRAKFKIFNVRKDVDFEPYGKNIHLGSKHAEEYISNIPIKRSNIAMLRYTADYPDRVVYLDTRHTKTIDRIRKTSDIKSESFAKYKKAAGEEVDAELED